MSAGDPGRRQKGIIAVIFALLWCFGVYTAKGRALAELGDSLAEVGSERAQGLNLLWRRVQRAGYGKGKHLQVLAVLNLDIFILVN